MEISYSCCKCGDHVGHPELFVGRSYCPKCYSTEFEVVRVVHTPVESLLKADGEIKGVILHDAKSDPRVRAHMMSISSEVAVRHRMENNPGAEIGTTTFRDQTIKVNKFLRHSPELNSLVGSSAYHRYREKYEEKYYLGALLARHSLFHGYDVTNLSQVPETVWSLLRDYFVEGEVTYDVLFQFFNVLTEYLLTLNPLKLTEAMVVLRRELRELRMEKNNPVLSDAVKVLHLLKHASPALHALVNSKAYLSYKYAEGRTPNEYFVETLAQHALERGYSATRYGRLPETFWHILRQHFEVGFVETSFIKNLLDQVTFFLKDDSRHQQFDMVMDKLERDLVMRRKVKELKLKAAAAAVVNVKDGTYRPPMDVDFSQGSDTVVHDEGEEPEEEDDEDGNDAPLGTATTATTVTKETTVMTEPKNLFDRAMEKGREDVVDVSYQVAARQVAKMLRDPLVALLTNGEDASEADTALLRIKVGHFLDTDLGLGLVMGLMGIGLPWIPIDDARVQTLAKALRVRAGVSFGDAGADALIAPLMGKIVDLIKSLPEPKKESEPTGVRATPDDVEHEDTEAGAAARRAQKHAVR